MISITQTLAREVGPAGIYVNAIAPGVILWPESDLDEMSKQRIISRTPLKRSGDTEDVARTVLFLVRDAGFITGSDLLIDGGVIAAMRAGRLNLLAM